MKKTILFFTILLFTASLVFGVTVQIGTGTSTGQHLPIEPYYGYTYSQTIYLSSDFGTPGADQRIEKIWYNYSWTGGDDDSDTWVIYMGTTANATLTDWLPVSGLEEVFSGDVDLELVSGDGWIEITLDTPFDYNPATDGNLVIGVDENMPSYTSNSDEFYCDLDARANVSIYYYSDGTNPDPASPPSGTLSAYYPNTQFDFQTIPSCVAPTAQTEDTITTSGANLGWTSADSFFDIYVVPTNDPAPTAGSTPTVNDNSGTSYTWSGGSANNTYDWYVRTDCGQDNTDVSTWTGPSTFTTLCDAYTAPFSENFDSVTPPTLPDCWSKLVIGASTYAYVETSTTGSNSAPNNVRMYNHSLIGAGDYLLLITPQLSDLTSQSNQIRFMGRASGYAQDLIIGTMSNPADETTFTAFQTIPLSIDTYTEYTVLFDASYTLTDEYIAFRDGADVTYRYLNIDDFVYEPIPACPPPSDLTAGTITTTSASLGWTENGSATVWNIELGAAGFTPTGTPTQSGVTNPYTYSGLTAATSYDWYVQADCGTRETSTWSGPSTFSTLCEAVTTFPLTEDFDGTWFGSPAAPLCWSVVNNDADSYTWTQDDTYITPHSGLWTAHGMGSNDDYLITPALVFADNYRLKWWDVVESATYNNTYDVLVSTTTDDIASFTNNLGTYDCTNTTWTEHILNLSAYNGETIYIAFHQTYSAATYYGFGIDDVTIEEIPGCPEPSAQTAGTITTTSASLGWTESGSATLWDIEWGTTGFTQGTGTMITGTTTNPHSLSGLTAGTGYSWYVRADCGTRETSPWSGPHNFATLVTNDVCTDAIAIGEVTDLAWNTSTATTSGFDTHSINQDIWYVYTPSANGLATFDLCGSTFDTKLAVYGECDVATELGYNDDSSYCDADERSVQSAILDLPVVYGEDYMIQVGGYGSNSGAGDLTITLITCPAPTAQTTTAIGPTQADLGWTLGLGETSWDIEIDTTGFTPTGTPTYSGVTNPYTVTGLNSSTSYEWYVRADCGGSDYSTWTGPVSFTTLVQCPAPTNLTATSIGPDQADLGWTEMWTATSWDIEIDTTGFTPTGTPTYSGVTNPYTVTGLLNETSYEWYVRADCGTDETSTWVGPASFTTLVQCPAPTNLTATSIGPDQADLGWTEMWTATSWDIEIDTTGFTPTGTPTYSGVTNPYTVTGLLNETSYEWYVRADCGTDETSTWVGPASFTTLVACPAPTSPNTTNILQTSADLDWTDGWAEINWYVEWDTTGFALGTGNLITLTSHPHGLTTLTANTSYDWYVQADCDGPFIPGDESVWVGPITFTTLCTPIASFPYTENFDALSTVPDCWVVDPVVSGDSWEVFSSNPGHGAPNDHTTGTGNFMGVDDSSPETVPAHLYSIPFDLTSLSVPLLEFYYWIGDATTTSELHIDIDDGTTVTTDVAVFGETIDHWALAQVNLGAFAGLSIIIDFRAMESTSFYGDICLDDVTIKETPLCPEPTNLYTDTITDTTANLNWTAGGTEPNWNIEWGAAGFTQGTGTMILNTTNPDTLTGLASATDYDWYVQADCDGGATRDESSWAGPSTFTTTGSYSLPYTQDFATWLPPGWTISGGTNWKQGLGNSAGGTAPEALFYWSPGTTATQRLISPTINTVGETHINVEFRHYLDNYSGPLTIMLQTTSDGGVTWNTTSFNFVDPVGNIGPEFQSIMVNNADVGSENFQCAFVFDGYSFNLNNWYVDDVEVIVSPPATLAITPSPFDFGDVPYNKIPTQVFTMSNTGVGTVTVNSASDITLSGDSEFIIVDTYFSNTPAVIPSDTVTVEVQFAPSAAVSYSTVLSVVWTGAIRSTTDATITGTGCTPVPNDDCVNATAISSYPATGSGSNECAFIDCPGLLDWNTIWYEIDLPYECQDVEITICAADTNTVLASVGIILMDDCACDDYIVRDINLGAGWITCASGAQGYNMIFPSITGYSTMLWPSYLVDADGGVAFDYEIDVTPCETPNAPQDVSVAVAGANVTVSWTYHSELTYTVYSDTDPYGAFTNVEGSGIAADHLDITPIPGVPTFYRVTCDNPPVRTRTYSDGIGITERAPKVIAPNRMDPSNQRRK